MIVYSYIREGLALVPVEIELSLTPGLPVFRFLGLPDKLIKESEIRIKAALKSQGFEIPSAKQVLIQLRPSHIHKHSLGLDLAVAAAFLWETKQIQKPLGNKIKLYGELTFKGDVICPSDFNDISEDQDVLVYSGVSSEKLNRPYLRLENLRELAVPELVENPLEEDLTHSVLAENTLLTPTQAQVVKVVALGQHPTLLVGAPGTGKSTLAEIISQMIYPNKKEIQDSFRVARFFGENLKSLPIRRPHHKATPLAIIGGGRPPQPGEITRAHGGVLIMDEFLHFAPEIQEALREPLETGKILVSRAGRSIEFPARFLLIATSNLCPCGQFMPLANHRCRCRQSVRRNYIEKLSGPIIDRFHVIGLSLGVGEQRTVSVKAINESIKEARMFAQKTRNQNTPNSMIPLDKLLGYVSKDALKVYDNLSQSIRKQRAIYSVARTIADLDENEIISQKHVESSLNLTLKTCEKMTTEIHNYI